MSNTEMRFEDNKEVRRYRRMRKRRDNEDRLERKINGTKRIHSVEEDPHESSIELLNRINKGDFYDDED